MLHETAEPSIEFNRSHVNFKCFDKKLSDIQGVWTNFIDFSHICIDYHVFLNKFNFDRTYWCLYLFIGFHRLSWMRMDFHFNWSSIILFNFSSLVVRKNFVVLSSQKNSFQTPWTTRVRQISSLTARQVLLATRRSGFRIEIQ